MSLAIFTGKYGGKYYQFVDSHIKYTIQFPLEHAVNIESNTQCGPLNCSKCRYRSYRGIFMGYCHVCNSSCKCSFENGEVYLCNMRSCIMNTYLKGVDLQKIGENEIDETTLTSFHTPQVSSLEVNYYDNLIEFDNSTIATIDTEDTEGACENLNKQSFIFDDPVKNQTIDHSQYYMNLAEQYIKSSYK